MSFIDAQTMKETIAATFRKAASALPPAWDLLIANALDLSYADILQALLVKGWSKTQIDAWDQGESVQLAQGFWYLLKNQKILEAAGLSSEDVAAFSRADYLKGVQVLLTGGVLVDPAGPAGQPATGTLTGESDDELHRRQYDARPSWEYDRHPSCCDPYGECC